VGEDAARGALASQVDQIKGLDTKSGLILGGSGAILAILAGSSGIQDAKAAGLALVFGSLGFIAAASVAAVSSLWPQVLDVPPNPIRVYGRYLRRPAQQTRFEILRRQVRPYRLNETVLNRKLFRLRFSAVAFLLGLALLLTGVVYNGIEGRSDSDYQGRPPTPARTSP
jgi:hypothetical protein